MASKAEIIIVPADLAPVQGWHLLWGFSKQQLDIVLFDIEKNGMEQENGEDYLLDQTTWQDETLDVVSLERYFGLTSKKSTHSNKYAIVKGVVEKKDGMRFGRIVIPLRGNLSVRDADFPAFPASIKMVPKRGEDVLGIYSFSGRQLLLIPDITSIYLKLNKTLV